jgi:hypothetical protein
VCVCVCVCVCACACACAWAREGACGRVRRLMMVLQLVVVTLCVYKWSINWAPIQTALVVTLTHDNKLYENMQVHKSATNLNFLSLSSLYILY